jgi:hypothetical protein
LLFFIKTPFLRTILLLGALNMSIKKTVLAASMALLASSAIAGDVKALHGVEGSLGSSPLAVDIMRISCGTPITGVTVDHAHASINDLFPEAKPRLNVMIAKWNGSTCVNWTTPAGDPIDDDAVPSAEKEVGGIPAVGGKYCVAVFKTPDNQNTGTGSKTSYGAENYELETACGQEGVEEHPDPIVDGYFING